MEYRLGMNPLVAERTTPFVASMDAATGALQMDYSEVTERSDVTLQVLGSRTLQNWSPNDVTLWDLGTVAGRRSTRAVLAPLPEERSGFLRLEISD